MRTSLDHLPQYTRERLAHILHVLRETGPVEMVILFGSHARGTQENDLATGFKSDFDILVVTKTAEVADDVSLWAKATERFLSMPKGWPDVDLIVHDFAFIAYMPKSHNIEKLADMAAHIHPEMRPLLPRKEPEDERLFELLKKAYVDARYSTKYSITAQELGVLGARVRELGEVIERVCREKIAGLG